MCPPSTISALVVPVASKSLLPTICWLMMPPTANSRIAIATPAAPRPLGVPGITPLKSLPRMGILTNLDKNPAIPSRTFSAISLKLNLDSLAPSTDSSIPTCSWLSGSSETLSSSSPSSTHSSSSKPSEVPSGSSESACSLSHHS